MMKNFKKFTAFVLALCMLFSLSVAAFAAEADVHTVYDSALDEEIATQSDGCFRHDPRQQDQVGIE